MPTIFTRGAGSALAYGWSRITAFLDPYFNYVTMLLPGNGTNGAQNNTFLDGSTNNFTITRNGNTTQGTFSPYGSNWSMGTSATGSYLTIPQNTAFAFGTGDFTIEAWVSRGEGSRQQGIVDTRGAGSGAVGVLFYTTAQGYLTVYDGTGTVVGGSAATVLPGYQGINTWAHVAVTRSGTTTRLFINGTIVATLAGDTRNYLNGAGGTLIARQFGSTANDWVGYISNVRIVKGTALYTANFTPSTTPLTAVSGTSLLTCQSNRFVDNSGNNFTVTPTGTPSVQRFSPFIPTASYSSATVGGSGYFDGTGDYLSIPGSTAIVCTGDFSVSCWVYLTSLPSYQALFGQYYTGGSAPDQWLLELTSSGGAILYCDGPGSNRISVASGTFTTGQWQYVNIVRSGTTITIYVNGVSKGTTTKTDTWGTSSYALLVGAYYSPAAEFVYGYMSDFRFIKGTAVTGVPTSPLTAVTNTSVLLNMTNAGIIDNAMMNDLETVGNAQISTTQSKFGGSSMYFDGTGDYLISRNNYGFEFGTSDFTVEMWIRTTYGAGYIVGHTASGGNAWVLTFSSNLLYWVSEFNTTNLYNRSATSILDGNWHHVAVTRASGTQRMFFDGVLQGATVSDTTNYNSTTNYAVANPGGTYNAFNGYMNDLRITKGYARYTANFTAPTAAFPTS
jgi:hypothetical protein